jgi:hypothetical protein
VLATLSPSERVTFVLHDVVAVRVDEIGSILGRSPQRRQAARQRRPP